MAVSKVPGMTKRGDTYWADFTRRGERIRRSLETTVKKVAVERLDKLRADAGNGDWGLLDNRLPLAEVQAQYLRHVAQTKAGATHEAYAVRLNNILPKMPREVHQLRHQHVLAYREERQAQGFGNGSINSDVITLTGALNWAVKAGLIASCPIKGIERLPHEPRGARPLTEEEIGLLLEHSPERWARVWYCLATTGLRRCEIVGLRFDHIDVEGRELDIPAELAKGSKPRRLPIDARLWSYLEDALVDRGAKGTVFGITVTTIRHALRRCCKLAGIDDTDVSPHSLRKSFCIACFRAGGDPATVMELMGHASVEITLKVYRLVAAVDRSKVIARLAWGSGRVAKPDHIVTISTPDERGESTQAVDRQQVRTGT